MVNKQQCLLQQVSCLDICVTTCKILLLLFCICDYLVLILKFSTVGVCMHDVTSFLIHETLLSKHVLIFLPLKYDVISQLRQSYAKDPFCMMRLISIWTLLLLGAFMFYKHILFAA